MAGKRRCSEVRGPSLLACAEVRRHYDHTMKLWIEPAEAR